MLDTVTTVVYILKIAAHLDQYSLIENSFLPVTLFFCAEEKKKKKKKKCINKVL
jgi:hypothetical protein